MTDIGEEGIPARKFYKDNGGQWRDEKRNVWWSGGHITDKDVKCYDHVLAYQKLYGIPKSGRHRSTFDRGDGYVVKVPHMASGEDAIVHEASVSEDQSLPVARCWLEDSKVMPGMIVLIMEKVDTKAHPSPYDEDYPEWAYKLHDAHQLGTTADGRLVVYDI
jgi:hypothetical protein